MDPVWIRAGGIDLADLGCRNQNDATERPDPVNVPAGADLFVRAGDLFFDFAESPGGQLTVEPFAIPAAEFTATPPPGLQPFGFTSQTDPVRLWEIDFDGPLAAPVCIIFPYDRSELLPGVGEFDIRVVHYANGEWIVYQWPDLIIFSESIRVCGITSLSPFLKGETR